MIGHTNKQKKIEITTLYSDKQKKLWNRKSFLDSIYDFKYSNEQAQYLYSVNPLIS